LDEIILTFVVGSKNPKFELILVMIEAESTAVVDLPNILLHFSCCDHSTSIWRR
jgi:hypothetical protein